MRLNLVTVDLINNLVAELGRVGIAIGSAESFLRTTISSRSR